MFVIVCGPHALSDSVRSALASEIAGPTGILRGRPSVTLHVEKFGMAVSSTILIYSNTITDVLLKVIGLEHSYFLPFLL